MQDVQAAMMETCVGSAEAFSLEENVGSYIFTWADVYPVGIFQRDVRTLGRAVPHVIFLVAHSPGQVFQRNTKYDTATFSRGSTRSF